MVYHISDIMEPTTATTLKLSKSNIKAPVLVDPYKIIAAIDFGTTFSSYAYALSSDKDTIYTNRNWGQTQGFLLQKTPTCLLLKPSSEFAAFGFEAVSKYNDLTEDEASEYYYFDRFKMKLYDNKVRILILFVWFFNLKIAFSTYIFFA